MYQDIDVRVGMIDMDVQSGLSIHAGQYDQMVGQDIQKRIQKIIPQYQLDQFMLVQFVFDTQSDDMFELGSLVGEIQAMIQLLHSQIEEETFIAHYDVSVRDKLADNQYTLPEGKEIVVTVLLDSKVFADLVEDRFEFLRSTGVQDISFDLSFSAPLPTGDECVPLSSFLPVDGIIPDVLEEELNFLVDIKGKANKHIFKDFF
eukprot:TRINITY_DN3621_c0_g1_i3.p2 TRINITY_DN3621_c0_g1~~TRINITY_DN3621_c0_g1_i3.p2  ORF type:complete len:203 (-),score=49.26 TRINITY_DN3621_c0_g1_i3:913-1521(-)